MNHKLTLLAINFATRAIVNAIFSIRDDANLATKDEHHVRAQSFLHLLDEIVQDGLKKE